MNIFVKNCLWLRASISTVVLVLFYFNLEEKIKQNCEFEFYFNKTNIMPSVLDGGHEVVLANWPSYKRIICTHNNNIPVNILSHPICPFGKKHSMQL